MKSTVEPRGSTRMLRASSDAAKEKRRADILTAASSVFAARGFHATTIKDVARAADVSYGLVYRYFESKEALFHALMDEHSQALRRHIDGAVAERLAAGTRMDETEVLRVSVRATFEFFEADRDVARLLFRDALALGEGVDRHLAATYESFIADIERAVVAAQASGHVIDAPPRLLAVSIAAQVSQLALRRLSTDDGVPAEVVADVAVRLLVDGLRRRDHPVGDSSGNGR